MSMRTHKVVSAGEREMKKRKDDEQGRTTRPCENGSQCGGGEREKEKEEDRQLALVEIDLTKTHGGLRE
jgi:hypothetical protein